MTALPLALMRQRRRGRTPFAPGRTIGVAGRPQVRLMVMPRAAVDLHHRRAHSPEWALSPMAPQLLAKVSSRFRLAGLSLIAAAARSSSRG